LISPVKTSDAKLATSSTHSLTRYSRDVPALQARLEKYVDPENVAIVSVGDRKVIDPGLRAANVAPIVIVDENGKAMP